MTRLKRLPADIAETAEITKLADLGNGTEITERVA